MSAGQFQKGLREVLTDWWEPQDCSSLTSVNNDSSTMGRAAGLSPTLGCGGKAVHRHSQRGPGWICPVSPLNSAPGDKIFSEALRGTEGQASTMTGRPMILSLECASESPGGLVQVLLAKPHPQSF